MTSHQKNAISIALGSTLGVMVAILCLVLILFYKKRNESIHWHPHIEKMTRNLKKMSRSVMKNSQRDKNEDVNSTGNLSMSLPSFRVFFFFEKFFGG